VSYTHFDYCDIVIQKQVMGFQILLLTYFLVSLVIVQHGNSQRVNVGAGFVQRKGTHFILNGKPYYLNGFNSYWLMTMASDPSTRAKVTSTFQQASQHGLNVGRTWAFNDGDYKPLQISPGSYDENVFKVIFLDYYLNYIKISLNIIYI